MQRPGEFVSLATIAGRLAGRLQSNESLRSVRPALTALLDRVRDTRPLLASTTHGDLKPGNLLVSVEGDLVGIDWEFAAAPSLGFLDLIAFALFRNFADQGIDSFEGLFDEKVLSILNEYRGRAFGDAAPPLEELLALHICQYTLDRFGMSGLPPRGATANKGRPHPFMTLVASSWPFK